MWKLRLLRIRLIHCHFQILLSDFALLVAASSNLHICIIFPQLDYGREVSHKKVPKRNYLFKARTATIEAWNDGQSSYGCIIPR